MFQEYKTAHIHPGIHAVTGTTAATMAGGKMSPFRTGAGAADIAIAPAERTYFINAAVTGIAGVTGMYIAQFFQPVSAIPTARIVCSGSISMQNVPADAQVMMFSIDRDITADSAITFTESTIRWYPVEYRQTGTTKSGINGVFSCSIANDMPDNLPRYFGIALLGTYGTAAATITGAISLTQNSADLQTFMPNK